MDSVPSSGGLWGPGSDGYCSTPTIAHAPPPVVWPWRAPDLSLRVLSSANVEIPGRRRTPLAEDGPSLGQILLSLAFALRKPSCP